jgi:octaprenyl-diphosphate synthase
MDRKTASLFAACTRLGAIAGGAGEEEQALLGEFGWNLGMAFQVIDDVLDFTSHETVLGKPVGNDLREGKITLPMSFALELATPEEREHVRRVLADGHYEGVGFDQIKAIIERYDGAVRARERAGEFTSKARRILATFPDTPARGALMAATDLVAERDR